MEHISAEIITIGTELLLGELVDSNSAHIARVFRGVGINIFMMATVGDNRERIASAIRNGLSRSQIVITTGGLGPTVDDMTRDAVADATGRTLVYHPLLYDQIAARFAGYRVRMTENNRQQAYLPADAILIENPVGTAPSFIVESGDGAVISLPGVPREMKYLLSERIVPYLNERYQLGTIVARVLRTAGIGESSLDDLIGSDLLSRNNPTIGLAAHSGQVDVRITAKANSDTEANELIAQTETEVRARIGQYIFGCGDVALADVFLKLLAQQGVSITLVNAGISDVIGTHLAARPRESRSLWSSNTFASAAALAREMHIDTDAPLRELAEFAAKRYRERQKHALAIAIASYDDDFERIDDEAGTAVAVASATQLSSRSYGFGGRHPLAQLWVTSWALARGWQALVSETSAP